MGEAWAVTVTPIPKFHLPLTLLFTNLTQSHHHAANILSCTENGYGLDTIYPGNSEPSHFMEAELHLRPMPRPAVPPNIAIAPVS